MIKPKTPLFYHFCGVKSMPMESKAAICPFYLEQTSKAIRCEGLVSETVINVFRTAQKRERYQERFCKCFDYHKCCLAGLLIRKYDD